MEQKPLPIFNPAVPSILMAAFAFVVAYICANYLDLIRNL